MNKVPITSKEEKKRNVKLACKKCIPTQIIEKAKTTRQKAKSNEPDDKLDHLKIKEDGYASVKEWAKLRAYNVAVSDLTTIKCYVCGGPGHFFEVCPLHLSLEIRFGVHGLRSAIYGRAITLLVEQN